MHGRMDGWMDALDALADIVRTQTRREHSTTLIIATFHTTIPT